MSNNNTAYCQIIDLVVNSGDDLDLPLVITVGTYPSTTPQNITGWAITFVVKNLQTDTIPVLTNTVTSHVDPINGLTVIFNPASTTSTLSGWYYYYLSLVDNYGGTQCFQKGKINFTI